MYKSSRETLLFKFCFRLSSATTALKRVHELEEMLIDRHLPAAGVPVSEKAHEVNSNTRHTRHVRVWN